MSGQNWRTEVDAIDHFGHQKKRVELEQRRPVIRKASDLVGPGIGASAVQVTDFNDTLATFNGFFSAIPGALNAPDAALPLAAREPFVGTTSSDSALGGRQTVIGLETAFEYTRIFVRNPSDESSISWGVWHGTERVPASVSSSGAYTDTSVPSGSPVSLAPPAITTIGASGTYSRSSESINILRPGVYTGVMHVTGFTADELTLTVAQVQHPHFNNIRSVSLGPTPIVPTLTIPLTFWTTGDLQQIRILVMHQAGAPRYVTWRNLTITRIGDMA